MTEKADYQEIINEYKEQVRVLKEQLNELTDAAKAKDSALKRTLQTAKALSKYVSYSEMIKDKDLIEQNYGDWSGKKISEIWKTLSEIKECSWSTSIISLASSSKCIFSIMIL